MRSFGAWLAAALPPLIAVATFLCFVTPRITVATLAIFALVILSLALLEGERLRNLIKPDIGLWLFVVLSIYLLINATWSDDTSRALNKAVLVVLFAALSIGTVRAVLAWPVERARRCAKGFVIGVMLGAAYLLIELLSGQALARGFFNLMPFVEPSNFKGMVVEGGKIVSIRASELNRGVAIVLMTFWPFLLCIVGRRSLTQRWLIGGAAFVIATFLIMISRHNTSQMAIFVSLAVFLATLVLPRPGWIAVTAAWCLSFVIVVPLVIAAYNADLHHAKWLPNSAQARVVLWSYTAHALHEAPILGIGGSSTRAQAAEPAAIAKAKEATAEGKPYAWQAGPHAHNQYLQTWYELGLVGVVLAMACGAGCSGSSAGCRMISCPTWWRISPPSPPCRRLRGACGRHG
ncbi:O-Antigen ligase [Methyloligella halotolerans]|uniref:O-Antigen ligase n=1 Tax=Methyloligella halotolerans TaxID=1177755 RepID=A0A1E2S078_9HYPH|nr:O-antigen ligase family protein [Methyloligella halotolerans]ODA67812.1 O-Antigen ligase [Methyloligella halotolerans]